MPQARWLLIGTLPLAVTKLSIFGKEIDVAYQENFEGKNIKPQVDHFILLNVNKIIVLPEDCLLSLACSKGLLSFVMNNPFASLASIQIKLLVKAVDFAKEIYVLFKQIDAMESFLCFGRLLCKAR